MVTDPRKRSGGLGLSLATSNFAIRFRKGGYCEGKAVSVCRAMRYMGVLYIGVTRKLEFSSHQPNPTLLRTTLGC